MPAMLQFVAAGVAAIGVGAAAAALAQRGAPPPPVNPLAAPWQGPYGGVPPWDAVTPGNFPPALEAALAQERAEIAAIVQNTEPATFDNTIAALDRSGATRDRVERLFGVARQNVTNAQFQALEREWQPRLAAATDAIILHEGLFRRIEAVYRSLDASNLAADQKRLATRTYEAFVRRGARLDAARKTQLSNINQELATLYSDFRQKLLADENTWTVLDREDDLAGLPPSLVDSARAAAAERKLEGTKWAIVNTRSSVDPFLTFSQRRDLRERVWKKFKGRGDNGDGNDTKPIIARIVRLRADRARLLGFASHAHWQMDDTMARDPRAAQALMMRVWPAAVARVKEEVADMQAVAAKENGPSAIEPWDYLYYAEKVRQARYDLDQAELKPYFELDNMVAAAFWAAERRYDISFHEITGTVPVFHPDVRVFEVRDAGSGAHRGLFYLDNFARAGKRSGAWHTRYRSQRTSGRVSGISANNNNFVKAAAGQPVLISLDDAETLFHEFGHALHALLQDVRYQALEGTPRDFVEYPSQVNENWVLTREVLDRFARHYDTKQPMPQALVEKVERARKFNQGYVTVEYLADAILDMELHLRPDGRFDPAAFEREELARIGMPREIALRHRLPHFDHLFGSDAYSAGYYSYIWSDVMAADTWQAFVEAGGPWDKTVAGRFRSIILAEGNSTDRAEAFRRFRGRDPDVKALFEERGFPVGVVD